MAPSPENDNTPKAPDKGDKNKPEKLAPSEASKENDKDEKALSTRVAQLAQLHLAGINQEKIITLPVTRDPYASRSFTQYQLSGQFVISIAVYCRNYLWFQTLSNLNDGELKALLDEAINYKNPKDREGKSKLFKDLLNQAEESERIARATNAGGSEVARHYNTSAARRHHGRQGGGGGGGGRHHGRHRKPSSISENMMHGGSLDNLAKEELFLESPHYLVNKMKTVSARQREGGSLPCDVNSSVIPAHDYQFLEEAKRNKAMKDKKSSATENESSLESQRLLDHDSLAENYQETQEITIVPRYTSTATLQISAHPVAPAAAVDDPIPLDLDSVVERKPYDADLISTKVLQTKYNVYIPAFKGEERKVDENGNLHQTPNQKTKKKKTQTDKNVVVLTAESVEGHRSDIINDVDKLIQYVLGDKDDNTGGKATKSNVHKSKQLHKQHASEDSGRGGSSSSSAAKKQRAHSSKGKESRSEMKKSNSLGEISTAKLDDFAFVTNEEDDKESNVVIRSNKNQSERPKERRSWGNVEPPSFQILSSNASTDNLETAENWVVSKTKKKSKRRRNSVSSGSGRRQTSTADTEAAKQHSNRAPSPDLRGKSVPHSEKSDSSDVDSVHSLPIEGINMPISYADIARTAAEKIKEKINKVDKVPIKDKSTINNKIETELNYNSKKETREIRDKLVPSMPTDVSQAKSVPPPDVNDTKSFPAMPVEFHNQKTTDNNPDVVNSISKTFPPNVNDTKSFPAMPSEGAIAKNFYSTPPADVTMVMSFPAVATTNNKGYSVEKANVRNVSISGRVTNESSVPKSKPTLNSNSAVINNAIPVTASSTVPYNDIQNDLSIIHSNEKDSIHLNAHKLPPNIPDVQTIEKLHFMNCHPHKRSSSSSGAAAACRYAGQPDSVRLPSPIEIDGQPKRQDCDMDASTGVEEDDDERPPPVVILSGVGNKEVTGLVFGFDVNEQLLQEDVCEDFIARFVAPQTFSSSSHNHEKIVNFIGTAWEAIVNQANGKVQFYTEES
ncbi:unnamed protein product [Phyllotreta striolata]|uniref:Uncharacterized protein n=1 Tax=Phyllotreta striolata TaxID=444603 RepID=A0A9N9TRW3_PHYSR|nr:unnamed protein product [Phyllotreta striolata]